MRGKISRAFEATYLVVLLLCLCHSLIHQTYRGCYVAMNVLTNSRWKVMPANLSFLPMGMAGIIGIGYKEGTRNVLA